MSTSGAGAGRFAPSPTGDLHLGNLRTAVLAWLFARSSGRRFLLRVEDLDPQRSGAPDQQLADLAALGIDHDGPVIIQSHRAERHAEVLTELSERGLVYECFCTRREIAEASSAAHGAPVAEGAYPGTCRDLSADELAQRRASGRPAALRLRTHSATYAVHDRLHGRYVGTVDDFVLRRNDGAFAYNLAVVVDDADAGVDQVVRGDDLLPSTPRQAYLADLIGLPVPSYAHVPLALNAQGKRLSKRDGAVTLAQIGSPERVLGMIAASLGLGGPEEPVRLDDLLARFDPARLPREPWTVTG